MTLLFAASSCLHSSVDLGYHESASLSTVKLLVDATLCLNFDLFSCHTVVIFSNIIVIHIHSPQKYCSQLEVLPYDGLRDLIS